MRQKNWLKLNENRFPHSKQARRQDSVTGGSRNKFWGAREVYLCEFERGTGAREIYFRVNQTNKVKTKKKGLQFKNFHKFWLSSQNSCDFSRILKWRPKKKEKRFSSQKFNEMRYESTNITKIREVNTNLGVSGLDLHFISHEPVNFFGAQSSLGGAQFSFGGAQAVIWGARPRNAPLWRRDWFQIGEKIAIQLWNSFRFCSVNGPRIFSQRFWSDR